MSKSRPQGQPITIGRLPPDVISKLKIRAAANGRSMEAEVREILKAAEPA